MKKKIFNIIIILAIALLLVGCKSKTSSVNNIEGIDNSDLFNNKEKSGNIDTSNSTNLVDNLEITESGEYLISGDISETIIINVNKKDNVTLTLSNSNIIINGFAAIYCISANKLYINLVGNNTITSSGTFNQIDENTVDGAIFSKSDLSIIGSGSLTLTSSDHGIVAKDDLVITNSNIVINSSGKGIDANDSLSTLNAKLNITSLSDAIHVENSDDSSKGNIYLEKTDVTISSAKDGIYSNNILEIIDGNYSLTCTSSANISTQSMKGLKAKNNIILEPTTLSVTSKDDSIHSNNNILVEGGTINLSSNDDGIHADTKLVINDCSLNISKSYEGLESNEIVINGGTINVTSSDDGMNAAGGNDSSSFGGRPGMNSFNTTSSALINITGGNITINASGDGIDSNGSITMSGGNVLVFGPTDNGNGALDYDSTFTITGGTLCAIGSSGMAQNVSSATQGSILYNLSTSKSKNIVISLKYNDEVLYQVTSAKTFNSIVISTPDILKGKTYKLCVGANEYNITMSSYIYGTSSQSGPGGMGPGGQSGPGGRR